MRRMTHNFSGKPGSAIWQRMSLSLSRYWAKVKEQNKVFLHLIQSTIREYTRDQGQLMGAAMVYYAVLSIAPMILLFLSIIGFVLRFNTDGTFQNLATFIEGQFGPQLRNAIENLLTTVKAQAITVSGIGLAALILGGSSAFRFLSYSFRRIWRPTLRPAPLHIAVRALLRDQAVGVILLLAIVGLLSISLGILNLFQIAQAIFINVPVLQSFKSIELQPLLSILGGTIVLVFVYRYLPPDRLPWRDVWLGAFLAAVLWEASSILLRLYFDIRTSLVYGIIGSILVITIWVYTMCQVLFLGAEFCKVYGKWRKSARQQKAPS